MPKSVVYAALDLELVTDIIRFSDGKLDPFYMANDQLRGYVEASFIGDPDVWGDRLHEAAEKYAPHMLEQWIKEDAVQSIDRRDENRPLVWKEVSIRAGSEARMAYGDQHYYAKVQRGRIIDGGKEYSPSEWASKVAGGTSRNAWRDLWFREPMSKTWVPAQLLRDQTRQEIKELVESTPDDLGL